MAGNPKAFAKYQTAARQRAEDLIPAADTSSVGSSPQEIGGTTPNLEVDLKNTSIGSPLTGAETLANRRTSIRAQALFKDPVPNPDLVTNSTSAAGLVAGGTAAATDAAGSALDAGTGAVNKLTGGPVAALDGTKVSVQGKVSAVSEQANLPVPDTAPPVQKESKKAAVTNDTAIPIVPMPNVLHDYSSFTYRLTLGAMNVKDYNTMLDNEDPTTSEVITNRPKMTTTLMSSGGADRLETTQGNYVTRDSLFTEDFYFQDFKMTCIVGQNTYTQGSNAVNIEFTIYEPYGVSLIERLIALADKLGYNNYIEIPYLIRIDFIGYDSNNDPISGVIGNTTKFIPIRIANIKFKVNEAGAAYQVMAVPYNHMALNQLVATVPTNVTIPAGTVGSFFNKKSTGNSPGLVDVVNNWNKRLTDTLGQAGKPCRIIPDRIKITLDDEIANSKIRYKNLTKVSHSVNYGKGSGHHETANDSISIEEYDHHYNRGTSILAIIEGVIKNSEYYLKQVDAFEKTKDLREKQVGRSGEAGSALATGPHGRGAVPPPLKQPSFQNFKITTTYRLLDFDELANRHAYEATFHVQRYAVKGQSDTVVGQALPTNIAKDYNYLFTGNNLDILELDMEFNLVFFNSRSVNVKDSGSGTKQAIAENVSATDVKSSKPQNELTQVTTECIEIDQVNQAGHTGQGQEAKAIQIADAQANLLQNSRGDMVVLDVKILGDPAFIKQDDILYKSFSTVGEVLTPTGSIIQDRGEVYVRIKFNTRDDINHETGLRWDARDIPDSFTRRTSAFDGIYRIMKIDSEFIGGAFTQNLEMYRIYVQNEKEEKKEALTNTVPSDSEKAAGAVDVKIPEATVVPTAEEIAATAENPTGVIASPVLSEPLEPATIIPPTSEEAAGTFAFNNPDTFAPDLGDLNVTEEYNSSTGLYVSQLDDGTVTKVRDDTGFVRHFDPVTGKAITGQFDPVTGGTIIVN